MHRNPPRGVYPGKLRNDKTKLKTVQGMDIRTYSPHAHDGTAEMIRELTARTTGCR